MKNRQSSGLLLLAAVLCCSRNVAAQSIPVDSPNAKKDVQDYIESVLKRKKKADTAATAVGPGPFYASIPYPGYATVTGYLVGLTNSISFYTYLTGKPKISSILSETIYSQYHQFISTLNSNIWTKDAKYNVLGDWRYYRFPTNTFGLGSRSTVDDKIPVDYSYLRIYEVLMHAVTENILIGGGINYDYHWNVTKLNTNITDLDRYGYAKTSVSSGFSLNVLYDSRLNSNNPRDGDYAGLKIRNNLTGLGSDSNWQSMLLEARHYIQTSKRTGNILAFWSYNSITLSGKPPYFDLPSIGWDAYNNTGRGYVQGQFTGLSFLYVETEYRFRITKNELLGGVVFANASSFTEYPGNRLEKVNPGEGFGLRIKLNKRSGTNLCIDYGIGANGSRGLIFNLNEVF